MWEPPSDLLDLADAWARQFALVSDPTRLRLLLVMHYRGPEASTMSELAAAIGVQPATASAALRSLDRAGVVSASRVGRERRYALVDPQIHALLHHLGGRHEADQEHRHP